MRLSLIVDHCIVALCTRAGVAAETLVLCLSLAIPAHARDAGVTLSIVIVHGIPGHSAVHLQRGAQQLYWDPGGFYGSEYDDCVELSSVGACRRFGGFPWESLKAGRDNDIFRGENADLLRVLSIYHLDGDPESGVYSIQLYGGAGERAWQLLNDGREATFRTDRQPLFCVKSVAEYLDRLGGKFEGMPRPWLPGALATELTDRGLRKSATYTIESPVIQAYINTTRQTAGLADMYGTSPHQLVRRSGLATPLPGPP